MVVDYFYLEQGRLDSTNLVKEKPDSAITFMYLLFLLQPCGNCTLGLSDSSSVDEGGDGSYRDSVKVHADEPLASLVLDSSPGSSDTARSLPTRTRFRDASSQTPRNYHRKPVGLIGDPERTTWPSRACKYYALGPLLGAFPT